MTIGLKYQSFSCIISSQDITTEQFGVNKWVGIVIIVVLHFVIVNPPHNVISFR